MRESTCLVTGATSGIGEQIVIGLAARGADVLAVARSNERAAAAAARVRSHVPDARIETFTADLSSLSQIRALADQVRARRDRLDVLVLNAAVVRPRRELTGEGFEVDFVTNHLSPFLLTQLLVDLLRSSAPARVVTMSSSAHRRIKHLDLEGLPAGRGFRPMRTYETTKLLNVLFTAELARRLVGSGVTANAGDPGFARTALGRDATGTFGLFLKVARPFQLDPARAAATPLHLATAAHLDGPGGSFYAKCQPTPPSALAQDQAVARRLWELSETLAAKETAR